MTRRCEITSKSVTRAHWHQHVTVLVNSKPCWPQYRDCGWARVSTQGRFTGTVILLSDSGHRPVTVTRELLQGPKLTGPGRRDTGIMMVSRVKSLRRITTDKP
jgi:hypothetical protein